MKTYLFFSSKRSMFFFWHRAQISNPKIRLNKKKCFQKKKSNMHYMDLDKLSILIGSGTGGPRPPHFFSGGALEGP